MSTRLLYRVAERAKGRTEKPVLIYMKSGRTLTGNLGAIDAPNGTVEIAIRDSHGEYWDTLIACEAIEAIQPQWKDVA